MTGMIAIALPILSLLGIFAHKAIIGPAPEDHDPIPACIGRKLSYLLYLSGFLGLGGTGIIALVSNGELANRCGIYVLVTNE